MARSLATWHGGQCGEISVAVCEREREREREKEREREMCWEEREKVNKIRINFFGIFVLIVSYLRVYCISMPKILRFEISDEG